MRRSLAQSSPQKKSKTIGSGKNFFNLFGMPVSKPKEKKMKPKNQFKMPWSRSGPGPKMVVRQEDADKLVEGKAPLTVEQDGIMYQPIGKGADFNNVVDTVSAAGLVSPTGEQPGTQLADGIVGTSPVLAMLDAWFQENPDGVVALPLGPDGFEGQQDVNSMYPRGRASLSDASYTSPTRARPVMSAASGGDSDAFVPDMQRRTIMNLVLLGGAAVPVGWLGGGFVYFFVPAGGNSGGAGLVAKDALGDDVLFDKWLSTHQEGDRNLVQGLKGDAHYLIVTADKKIEDYALNAVCTHLGCVVPWNRAAGKFICPCHGSQYDNTGKVVRGPAPLSLALAHVDNVDNKVTLTPWTETDFRTNTAPWWK
jgi:cytochrome b6-f complex iron-sulfur subunit